LRWLYRKTVDLVMLYGVIIAIVVIEAWVVDVENGKVLARSQRSV
jgi:hypothetical protein